MLAQRPGIKLGPEIGRGGSRAVYAIEDRPGYVVKVPHGRRNKRHRYNLYEANIWAHAPDDLREWLVPVEAFCPEGQWLIMRQGVPITAEQRPAKVHRHLHDWRKIDNWVILDDRVLLCDYGQKFIFKALKICRDF